MRNIVFKRVVSDPLRKELLGKTMAGRLTIFLGSDAATDRQGTRMLQSSAFMMTVATYVRPRNRRMSYRNRDRGPVKYHNVVYHD